MTTLRTVFLAGGVFCLAVVLGLLRFDFADVSPPEAFLADLGQKVSYEGVVVAEPDLRDTHQRIPVAVERGGERVRLLVVVERYPRVKYGDKVHVTGTLTLPEPFAADYGRVFRYDWYLKKEGISFLLSFASIEVRTSRKEFSFYGALYDLKHSFEDALSRALPEPSASLASGLLVGGKQGLGEELQSAFIVSGLIHIVVLSGYNVMIVAVAVMRLLTFLPRRVAAVSAAATIGLFVLMAGAGAASVRAGLMAGLGLYARTTARTFDALRALVLVGLVMVLWNPLVLVYDPGFELSFLATAGLIVGAPLVARRLAFIRNEFMREIASSTIAAQIAVLPLLLYQTGLFSLVALPANLLVLPLVPLAMALSACAAVVALLIPPLSLVAGLPAYAIVSFIIAVAEGAAALPLASLALPAFPFALVIALYTALGYFVWRIKQRESISLHTSPS